MALTSAAGGGKTIAITGSSAGEMYTVPDGKTFDGYAWSNSSGGYGYINGTRLYWPYSNSYFAHQPLHVRMNGGDTFKADNSGTTMLHGIES